MQKNQNYFICPVCKCAYSGKKCPVCGYKTPCNCTNIICFFAIIIFAIFCIQYTSLKINPIPKNINNHTKANLTKIEIAPMIELSGMTRDEIFELRKNAVKKSKIFKIKNYKPNENVYKIEDNLPWIAAEQISRQGVENNPNIGKGASRNSIFILNPDFLIGFLVPQFNKRKPSQFSKADFFEPYKLLWDKNNNTIYAYFDLHSFFRLNPYNYPKGRGINMFIDETNARDMGYNWIYAQEAAKVYFGNKNNITITPYNMKGYYHKGYSCGLKSGCNNYSPYQPKMDFNIMSSGGYLKLKLWKNKPLNKYQKADLIYEMYFD